MGTDMDVNILAVLAERKIAEAMEEGLFDDLPGKGKPLPEDDLANLPDDVRLAFRILRMSGPTGAGASDGDAPALLGGARPGRGLGPSILEELDRKTPEEGKAYRNLESLRLRLGKKYPLNQDEEHKILESGYLGKILERLFPKK
jgi:hypothetical protein